MLNKDNINMIQDSFSAPQVEKTMFIWPTWEDSWYALRHYSGS